MLNQWNRLSTAVYVKAVLLAQNVGAELRELKEDQRGLSGVVVAVLLILVAVLAVVLLWGKLSEWLGTMWDKIAGKAKEIQ
jgi:Flp pilus assembly pilin Flp